ncbi:unnamed protein product [Caenorhabditis nigoni]
MSNSDNEPKSLKRRIETDEQKIPSSKRSNIPRKSLLESEKTFVVRHVFKDVSEFEEAIINSNKEEGHFNVPWSIGLKRKDGHLGYYINCHQSSNLKEFCVEVNANLIAIGPDGKMHNRPFHGISRARSSIGLMNFLKWETLVNDFLVNDSLTVEAQVRIIETSGLGKEKIRSFDETQQAVSDVVLVVRSSEFYVSRLFLAAQSTFFKAQLLGNFSGSNDPKVPLNGIDPFDFHYFLEVLHGESAIDDSTVEGVALLADMYDAQTAMRRCEEFLVEKSRKSLKKKLQMASRYRLESLKKQTLEKVQTTQDIRSIVSDNTNINDFDQATTLELLKKSVSQF